MELSDIVEQNRKVIRDVVVLHHARNPRVFGSVMRGEERKGSDLDLLVDPLPGTTLLDLGAIQFALESSLGFAVDVVTPGDLPIGFRDKVVAEAVPV